MMWDGTTWRKSSATGSTARATAEAAIGVPTGSTVSSAGISATCTGGLLLVNISGQLKTDGGASGQIVAAVDGVVTGFTKRLWTDKSIWDPGFSLTLPVQASPGSHTITVNVTCDAGSSNAIYVQGARLQVMEI